MPVPAEQLAGLTLDGGWKVLEKVARPPTATGGFFSHGYIVLSPDGQKAYLKALDYSIAFASIDPARPKEMKTKLTKTLSVTSVKKSQESYMLMRSAACTAPWRPLRVRTSSALR